METIKYYVVLESDGLDKEIRVLGLYRDRGEAQAAADGRRNELRKEGYEEDIETSVDSIYAYQLDGKIYLVAVVDFDDPYPKAEILKTVYKKEYAELWADGYMCAIEFTDIHIHTEVIELELPDGRR